VGDCHRCGKPLLDAEETDLMPFIPRWNLSFIVHRGCEPKPPEPSHFEVRIGASVGTVTRYREGKGWHTVNIEDCADDDRSGGAE
jgi:hypothetical protein